MTVERDRHSSSKYPCKRFLCKILFVQIELKEDFFTSHVHCVIIFVKIIFVCFSCTKIFLQRKNELCYTVAKTSIGVELVALNSHKIELQCITP